MGTPLRAAAMALNSARPTAGPRRSSSPTQKSRQDVRTPGLTLGFRLQGAKGGRGRGVRCCAGRVGRRELLGVGLAGLVFSSNGNALADGIPEATVSTASSQPSAPAPTPPAVTANPPQPEQPAEPLATQSTEGEPPRTQGPKKTKEELEIEAKRILDEEEKKEKKKKKSRFQELQDIRRELGDKQVQILEKEQDLLEKDQSIEVLKEELELERNLRELLIKEKEKADQQAKLALGLCGQSLLLP